METAVGTLRKTPLNPVHRELGAKMVAFGGWEMPVEYSGLITEHMAVRGAAGLFDVSHMGELEVEGPGALGFLQRVTSNNVAKLEDGQAQYSALTLPNGAPADDVIVYRRGPERFLLVVPDRAADLWRKLLEAGKEAGLVPAGLGARDTLRLEAKMCLYGNDMDETTTLVEAGLGWIVSLEAAKGDFVGRRVLEAQKKEGAPRKLVGFEMVDRGIARHGYPVYLGDEPAGSVTSGSYAPFLQKNIGLCYLPAPKTAVGTTFHVDIRGRRVAARIVPTPFYKRPQ